MEDEVKGCCHRYHHGDDHPAIWNDGEQTRSEYWRKTMAGDTKITNPSLNARKIAQRASTVLTLALSAASPPEGSAMVTSKLELNGKVKVDGTVLLV
jgi:hypothetical protein